MDEAIYIKLKGIVIRDLVADPHREHFHAKELQSDALTPEYRRAVEEVLEELQAARRQRAAASGTGPRPA
ncbi:MAG: hypothetical protein EOP24_34715 [Hyphomicrobiales bacterium]|nr:MAG: hypothetical protein EOP24_34715 [Hyphomicrobiales bacterium]